MKSGRNSNLGFPRVMAEPNDSVWTGSSARLTLRRQFLLLLPPTKWLRRFRGTERDGRVRVIVLFPCIRAILMLVVLGLASSLSAEPAHEVVADLVRPGRQPLSRLL